ncbi:SEL1-like repeat protein [Vibrio sp. A2-1]|uniref:SEL1-like repeat protein n=1 Tax=Vibrio sp. A2-1 TaxID=2912252 RepID=UPI003211A959
MYETGKGVPQDSRKSYMWLDLVKHSGHKVTKSTFDVLIKKMNPQDIKQAREMFKECLKSNYTNCG